MNTSMTYSSVSVWRVVIVEDDPEDMTEIRRLLLQGSDRRYQFVEAATGAAGVRAILDASNSPPDCVVLDYTLPDMDAMEVLAAVIGADGRTVCPVVVLTGTAGPEHGPAVLRAGAEDFISKSWMSAPSLTRAVDNAVERWAMTRELQAGKTALQVSETQLKLAVEVAGLGVNRIDYATNTVVLDTIAAALFGLQANVPLPRSAVHATFHPDDKDEIDRRMNQSLDPNADGTFSMEHRVIHPDGSVHWLCVKKQVLFSEVKGVRIPRSSVLAAVDVTGRKVAEADRMRLLQQAEGELARLADVFRHAPAFMCVLRGPDHVFELANDHYDQLVGHRQLLGRTVREAFPDIKGQGFIELLDNVYATGKPFIGSGFRLLFSQKPDRPPEERVVDFVYQASRDPSGTITGIVVVGIDVTDRKRAEEALRESQQFTRSVLENLFAFVGVMTADGTLIYANRAPVESAGIPASEVLGKKFWDCYWWNYSPEIQAQLRDACERAASGEIVRYDVPVRMGGDTRMWIDFQVAPLRDAEGHITHLIPSAVDIAVRRAAEEMLRASEERMRLATEATAVGIWEWNLPNSSVHWDAQMFRLYGIAPTADGYVQYSDWSGAVLPEDLPETERILRDTARRGGQSRREFRIHRRDDGEVRDIEAVETVRRNKCGEIEWVVGTNLDITERKLAEREVRVAKEGAETANAAKDRFLAVLSHELRTPLTPVLMTVGALEQDPGLSAEVREELAMIRRNIELETKLIDDLLDLNRITTGKLPLNIEPVDLNEAIRNACGICSPSVGERGIRFETELHAATGLVAADAPRLQQVLWNVLKNAIKFSSQNGLIRVTAKRLDGARCEVRVEDSGIGISPETLPRIFDAFEQGGTTVTRQFGGLGLGLAICKALVELHHGTIRAESSGEGKGATFIIELPGAAPLVKATDAVAPAAGAQGGRQLRLLVVEDHADTARTLARLLGRAGFAVVTASNVASALATAERETFDVLISDIGLPDGCGTDVMRGVRARSNVPGIAMSGYGMEEDVRRSREAGFSEHLVKPVDADKLKEAIRRVTENHGG